MFHRSLYQADLLQMTKLTRGKSNDSLDKFSYYILLVRRLPIAQFFYFSLSSVFFIFVLASRILI